MGPLGTPFWGAETRLSPGLRGFLEKRLVSLKKKVKSGRESGFPRLKHPPKGTPKDNSGCLWSSLGSHSGPNLHQLGPIPTLESINPRTMLIIYVLSAGGDISSSPLIGPYPDVLHHQKQNFALHDAVIFQFENPCIEAELIGLHGPIYPPWGHDQTST